MTTGGSSPAAVIANTRPYGSETSSTSFAVPFSSRMRATNASASAALCARGTAPLAHSARYASSACRSLPGLLQSVTRISPGSRSIVASGSKRSVTGFFTAST